MRSFPIFIACLTLTFSGCVTFPSTGKMSLTNPFNKKDKKPEPYPTPVKLAATWTPDTLSAPGKRPTRGFGGRIFFYDEKSRPVPVEGELTILAYEETSNIGDPSKVRRFGFTKEQLTEHYGQTDLGASYSVWIPWDADGGDGQRITLVPSFKAETMKAPIQGTPTVSLLAGPSAEHRAIEAARRTAMNQRVHPSIQTGSLHPSANPYSGPPGVQYASQYSNQPSGIQQAGFAPQPSQAYSPPNSGLNTLTIPVDSAFGRNIR